MSTDEQEKVTRTTPIPDYVEKLIDKPDQHLHKMVEQAILSPPLARFNKSAVIIQRDAKHLPRSDSTDHMAEPHLTSSPETDTLQESDQHEVRSHSQPSTLESADRLARDQAEEKPVRRRIPSQPISYNRYLPANPSVLTSRNLVHHKPESSARPQEPVRRPSANRYIEHRNTHTSVQVEFIRLPVVRLNPKEYHRRSVELSQLESIRSSMNDGETFHWRI